MHVYLKTPPSAWLPWINPHAYATIVQWTSEQSHNHSTLQSTKLERFEGQGLRLEKKATCLVHVHAWT
jgi:hypothetical protein